LISISPADTEARFRSGSGVSNVSSREDRPLTKRELIAESNAWLKTWIEHLRRCDDRRVALINLQRYSEGGHLPGGSRGFRNSLVFVCEQAAVQTARELAAEIYAPAEIRLNAACAVLCHCARFGKQYARDLSYDFVFTIPCPETWDQLALVQCLRTLMAEPDLWRPGQERIEARIEALLTRLRLPGCSGSNPYDRIWDGLQRAGELLKERMCTPPDRIRGGRRRRRVRSANGTGRRR
jgi:hypothetical protein